MDTIKKTKMKQISDSIFSKRTLTLAGMALAAAAFPLIADAATLGTVFSTIGTQSGTAATAGRDIAGFAGTILGITGFMTLRNHNDRDGKKKAFIELGSGAGLMGLAYVLNTIGNTVGDANNNATNALGSMPVG